jgi:hypothetical protein
MTTFSFIANTQDLVDAYNAKAIKNSKIRGVFRWLLLAFGWMWLIGGAYALLMGTGRLNGSFFLICGATILWQHAGRRLLDIYHIKNSRISEQRTTLKFSEGGIDVDTADTTGLNHSHKNWNQLLQFESSRLGLLFHFKDGFTHWLPQRAFSSEQDIKVLVEMLNCHIRQP